MRDLLISSRLHAALLIGCAAAQTQAHAQSSRAVLEPMAGVQVSYEHMGPHDNATAPGALEGSVTTPAGTLRTTVHAVPQGKQPFQRGDTSFELASPVLGGQLQLRELSAGGAAAAWRGRIDDSRTAETESKWTPTGTSQALRLNQDFGDGRMARAILLNASSPAGQGTRGEIEIAQDIGRSRWNAGIDASEQGFVAATGGEPGVGGLLGAQWLFLPNTRLEARYKWKLHSDADKPPSMLMVATRFDLPPRFSVVTSIESDTVDHKATLTLAVPLEFR